MVTDRDLNPETILCKVLGSAYGDQCHVVQAEDGIRDYKVTGVQTCALPILSSPPMTLGLLKSIATAIRIPHARKASAMRASCGRKSSSRRRGSALTLLMEQPLIPMEASKRAYSRTRVKSVRTLPSSKKIERPPYPRSIPPSRLSHWSTQRSRA